MKLINLGFAAGAIAAGILAGCSQGATTPRGIDTANLDTTACPRTDFYDYACGGWRAANPLPADKSRYGTFDVLGETAREQVRELVSSINPDTATAGTLSLIHI